MNPLKLFSIFVVLLLGTSTSWAVKIHECEDERGDLSFQKYCPPGSKSVAEKQYSNNTGSSDPKRTLPTLVLYAIPDCDVCDQMREHLTIRNIPITEKNVEDNSELQQELKSKTGGELRVPTLLVGDKVISGYDRTNLTSALTNAGYISEDADR